MIGCNSIAVDGVLDAEEADATDVLCTIRRPGKVHVMAPAG